MSVKVNSSVVRFVSMALLLFLMSGVGMAQQWVDIPSNVHPNQIVAQEIRDAVNNVLAAKGFTLVTGDKADLNVGYQCSADRERE